MLVDGDRFLEESHFSEIDEHYIEADLLKDFLFFLTSFLSPFWFCFSWKSLGEPI